MTNDVSEKERQHGIMSTYPLDELLKRWQHGDLSSEQAIGQTLQHLHLLYAQLLDLERRLTAAVAVVSLSGGDDRPAAKRGPRRS